MEKHGYKEMIMALAIISALILGSFSIFAMNPAEVNDKDNAVIAPSIVPETKRTRDIDPEFEDTENEEGNDFVAIDTPMTGGEEDAHFEAYIGELQVTYTVDLFNDKEDDNDERNGDDILYNVSVEFPNDEGDIWYELDDGSLALINDAGVPNPIADIAEDYMVKDDDPDHAYTEDNALSPSAKWGLNLYNTWVDENNDGTLQAGEAEEFFDNSPGNTAKTFGDFELNITPTAEPGWYVIPVDVSYEYQDSQPVAENGLTNGVGTDMVAHGDTDNYLGGFQYYFWRPYNVSASGQQYPTFAETPSGGPYTTTNMENISFKKIFPFDSGTHLLDVSQIDGENMARNNTGDLAADWWAIRDDHDNGDGTFWDNLNTSWDDGNTTELEDWIDDTGGNIFGGWDDVEALWDAWREASGTPIEIDRSAVYPPAALNGNGTWNHSGYIPDVEWHQANETLSNISRFSEREYLYVKIISTGSAPGGAAQPTYTIVPQDQFAGDTFEPWQITFTNNDPNVPEGDMENPIFTLTLPDPADSSVADDGYDMPNEGDFAFYQGFDAVSIPAGIAADGGTETLTWQIDTAADVAPGTYLGYLSIEYDKTYTVDQAHHAQVDVTVHMVEDMIPIEFEVDYTPGFDGDLPIVRAYTASQEEIDTSVGRHEFSVRIANEGNTPIYGGPNGTNNIIMDFNNFWRYGETIYDSNCDPFVEMEPIYIDYLDVGNFTDVLVDIEIDKFNLDEGKHRLMFDFYGFYYDEGVTGNPSHFVAFMITWMNLGGTLEPVMVRDENAPFYPAGGTGIGAFQAALNLAGAGAENMYTGVNGISADIMVWDFFDEENELREMPDLTISDNTATLTQGDDTSATVTATLTNDGDADITDLEAELLINELGPGFLAGDSYYEGATPIVDNPVANVDTLAAGDSTTVNFDIVGINPLIPPGLHRVPIRITSAYNDGRWNDPEIIDYDPDNPAADEYCRYNIVWDTTPLPADSFLDENENGVQDGGDKDIKNTMMIDVTVIDLQPDLKVQYDALASDTLYLGEPYSPNGAVVDRDIVVEITNMELYDLIDAEVELVCAGTPFLNPVDHTLPTIPGVFAGANQILSGNTADVTFTVDIDTNGTAGSFDTGIHVVSAMNANTFDSFADLAYSVPVRVYPVPPVITVNDYGVDGTVAPGSTFTLEVTIENHGDDAARNVFVTLGAELYNDDAFDLIDAFVSSISSADYNVDINGDTIPDGPYVVARQNNVTLDEVGIDNISDMMYAERMLKDPTAKINTFFISEIGAQETWTLEFEMRMDINAMVGREYVEDLVINFEDQRGVQRQNGPYPIKIETVGEGDKVWPGLEPDEATQSDVQDLKQSTEESMNNMMMALSAAIALAFILILIVAFYFSRRTQPAAEKPEKEEEPLPMAEPEPEPEELPMEEEIMPPEEELEGEEEKEMFPKEEEMGEEELAPPEFEGEEGLGEMEEEEEDWTLGGEEISEEPMEEPLEETEEEPVEETEEAGEEEGEEEPEAPEEEVEEDWTIGDEDLDVEEEEKKEE